MHDAPTTARTVGLPPRRGKYFLSKRKKVPKKARGTATPEAAHPAARNSQISAFRALPCPALVFAQACQSLTAFGSCAHWAHAPSRPKLRSAVAPLGLSSSTGCPVSHSSLLVALLASHPPCGSLWAAPKAPLGPRFPSGQFATLTRREKGFYCPFWRRGRNVARNEVGQLPPALGARSCSPFSAVKMGGPFSLRCLSTLCFAAGGAGQTQTAMLGMLRYDRDDSTARKNRLDFYSVVGINRTQIMSVWIFRHVLEFPETQKASGVSNPRWLFMRAMRPVAEWRSFLFN